MSEEELYSAYRAAWRTFFSPEHIERIGRRSFAQAKKGINLDEVTEFYLTFKLEGLHPLEGGLLRRRYRRDRRPGLPVQNPLAFYPWHWARSYGGLAFLAWSVWRANRLQKRLMKDPDRYAYTDLATTPPEADETATLALFQETSGGKAAVERDRVIANARAKATRAPNLLHGA